jgi:hypothetical protein
MTGALTTLAIQSLPASSIIGGHVAAVAAHEHAFGAAGHE